MTINDIPNFIQVSEHTALGGQPSEEHFRSAREAGYEVVINLAPTAATEGSLLNEPELLDALGFEYHHIPVAWAAPAIEEFDRFVRVMDGLGNRRALIHCAANFRVTAFYALYAIKQLGWSDEQAETLMDRVWKSRADYSMDDNWKNFIGLARQQMGAAAR